METENYDLGFQPMGFQPMSGRLEIDLGRIGTGSRVTLNGEDISHQLTAVAIETSVHGPTLAHLSFIDIEVTGTAVAVVNGLDGIERLRQRRLRPYGVKVIDRQEVTT